MHRSDAAPSSISHKARSVQELVQVLQQYGRLLFCNEVP